MKQKVLEIIANMTKAKQEADSFPDHLLDIEIRAEFRKQYNVAILELMKEKKIKGGKTINHNYIKLLSFSRRGENDENQ